MGAGQYFKNAGQPFRVAEHKVPAPKKYLALPENMLMGATKQTKLEVPENKFNVVGDWRATPEQLPGATPEQP